MHALTVALAQLLRKQRVASLATLDQEGLPQLSLVPFAMDADSGALVIHISALAAHTAALVRQPRGSLMVHEEAADEGSVHALHRVVMQVQATMPAPGDPAIDRLRALYLARFPEAQPITGLGDFRFVQMEVLGARQVAGFGAARTLDAEAFGQALHLAAGADGRHGT